jgi:hypothetical protein
MAQRYTNAATTDTVHLRLADRGFTEDVRQVILAINMSHSNADREANIELALKLFLEQLGDHWIKTSLIDPNASTYSDIYQTTWMELENRCLIAQSIVYQFVLTGYGWEKALALTGKRNDTTREQIGRICQSLKLRVKGRANPAGVEFVTIQDIKGDTGLSEGFISNIIEAKLIEQWLNREGAHWADGFDGRMVVVPLNFGLDIL